MARHQLEDAVQRQHTRQAACAEWKKLAEPGVRVPQELRLKAWPGGGEYLRRVRKSRLQADGMGPLPTPP